MGYAELLRALEAEVDRQIREIQEEADREARGILEETRRRLAAEREESLARERRRLDEEGRGVVARARLAEDRELLAEMRQLLAGLRRAAESRLPSLDQTSLLFRLVEELVPELGEAPLEFRVAKEREELLRQYLGRVHPELLARASVAASAPPGGGVEVSLGDRAVLDNSLASRLDKAWEGLEGDAAAVLFGGGDGV
jgi:vacuolar-type H+-ATPase subunit E/Vma4